MNRKSKRYGTFHSLIRQPIVIVIIIFYSFQERKIHLIISKQFRKIQTKELQQKCRESYETDLTTKLSKVDVNTDVDTILYQYEIAAR